MTLWPHLRQAMLQAPLSRMQCYFAVLCCIWCVQLWIGVRAHISSGQKGDLRNTCHRVCVRIAIHTTVALCISFSVVRFCHRVGVSTKTSQCMRSLQPFHWHKPARERTKDPQFIYEEWKRIRSTGVVQVVHQKNTAANGWAPLALITSACTRALPHRGLGTPNQT